MIRYYAEAELVNLTKPGEPTDIGHLVRVPSGREGKVVSFCADSYPKPSWPRGVELAE